MGPPSHIPDINDFSISTYPIRIATDHAYLAFSLITHTDSSTLTFPIPGYPRYHFTGEIVPYYATEVLDGIMDLDPSAPLATLTT